MPSVYSSFGLTPLPLFEGVHSTSTGPSRLPTSELMSGGSVVLSPPVAVTDSVTLSISGYLMADNADDLRAQIRPLRARKGQRDKLYRVDATGEVEWTWAWLVGINGDTTPDDVLEDEVSIDFFVELPLWNAQQHGTILTFGGGGHFGEGYVFGGTPDMQFSLTNLTGTTQDKIISLFKGSVPIDDTIIKINAGSTDITVVRIRVDGTVDFTWNGLIAAGRTLTIDTGAWSFIIDTTPTPTAALSGLQPLPATHTIPTLFRLNPSITTVKVSGTGGGTGSSIMFQFSEKDI